MTAMKFRVVADSPAFSATASIAAFFAGVAGTLFVTVEGSVFPDLMFWTLSLEILIMCLLGGWFIFMGPMFGAAIIVTAGMGAAHPDGLRLVKELAKVAAPLTAADRRYNENVATLVAAGMSEDIARQAAAQLK